MISRDRASRRAWGPIVLTLFVLGYGLWQATHLGGSYWDSDEGLNVMKAYLVQDGARLYTEIWSDQPPGLTQLLAWSFAIFGPTMTVARAVVLAHSLVLLFAVAWIVREAGGRWRYAINTAMLLAFAPNFFWASRAVMIGLPALSLAALSIAMAMAYARSGWRPWLLLAGLVFGVSLLEKLIGLYLVIPLAIAVWGRTSSSKSAPFAQRLRSLISDGFVMAFGTALVIIAALFVFDPRLMFEQTIGVVASARDIPEYALDRAWSWGKLRFWLMGEHRYLLGPALLGAALLLRQRTTAAWVLLSWLILTLLALFNQTPLWPKHHFLALLIIMAPLAGIAFEEVRRALERLIRSKSERTPRAIVTFLALVMLSVVPALQGLPDAFTANVMRLEAKPFKESGKLPKSDAWTKLDAAVEMVQAHTDPDDYIVTDHGVLAFKAGRRVPPQLAVISGKRLAVGGLTADMLIEVTRDGIMSIERSRSGAPFGLIKRLGETGQPAAVVLWNGDRLNRIPEYADWVRTNYMLADSIDDDYELWLRPGTSP